MHRATDEFYVINDEEGRTRDDLAELRGLKADRGTSSWGMTPVSPEFTKAYIGSKNRKAKRKLARMSRQINRKGRK